MRSNARSQSFRTGKTDQWAPPPPFAVPQSAAGGTNDWSGAPSARLREALDGQEHGALCDLIREKVHLQCEDEYAWIEELVELGYSDQGIADLLLEQKRESPWIRYKQLDLDIPVSPHFHLPGCVHQGGIEQVKNPVMAKESSDARLKALELNDSPTLDSAEIGQRVAASCGLGGIDSVKALSDGALAFGRALFNVAGTGELHATITYIHWSFMAKVLRQLSSVAGWLQQNQLCCSSFTVLARSDLLDTVELVAIPFEKLQELQRAVSSGYIELRTAHRYAVDILNLLPGRKLNDVSEGHSQAINCIALTTQVLALGILSYSNAHIGPLQPFYLERSLANITLAGTGYGSEKPITVDLANLACMGKMLGEPVMVFGWGPGLKWGSVDAYKLLASPEDLVDTWGPGRFVIDRHAPENEKLQAIEIGGGTILRTEDPSQFHWGQQPWVPDSTGRGFSSTEKIIIAGQPERNAACLLDHGRISHQSEAFLHRLGPVPEIWQLAERQFGLQVGQYGVAQFNATWKKRKSVTLKDMWLDEPNMSLSFLESYWGIQVSLCTGIAQRVPLRELIADVMEAFIGDRAQKPLKWDSLLQTHGILDRFRSTDFKQWFECLDGDLQAAVTDVVRYILTALRHTGFDKARQELVVAWALENDPFRCFRVRCEAHQLWGRILEDSEHCATFACVTSACLETDKRKCQGPSGAAWQDICASLATAVCQYELTAGPIAPRAAGNLHPDVRYWIGRPGADLVARLIVPDVPTDVHLAVSLSKIPEPVRRRLEFAKKPEDRSRRLRERQSIHMQAKEVFIQSAE